MEFAKTTIRHIMDSEMNKKKTEPAVTLVTEELEDKGCLIAEKAVEYAEEENRVTVRKKDMMKAIKDSKPL